MDALAGLVAVITNGGSTEGATIAAAVANHGATVVLYDPDAERTDSAAADIRHGWGTTAIQIGNPHAKRQDKLVADVIRTCSGLDALVILLDNKGLPESLIQAALPHIGAREHGFVVVVDPDLERPRIGKLEEALCAVRRLVGEETDRDIRCYSVASLPPGGSVGSAIAHLAITRPEEQMDGRVLVVPPA